MFTFSILTFFVFSSMAQEEIGRITLIDKKKIDFSFEYFISEKLLDVNSPEKNINWTGSRAAIPGFSPGKKYCYIKYRLKSDSSQDLLWVNTNVFLDYYSLEILENEKKIINYDELSWKTHSVKRPFPSVFFVCPVKLEKDKSYEIILCSKSELLPNKVVSYLFSEKGFHQFETRIQLVAGLASGILLLITLLTAGIYVVYRLRLFLIYALFTLTFWWIYFYITGEWFKIVPLDFFDNGFIRIPQLMLYTYFFTNLWFAWAFFKIDLESRSRLKLFYRLLYGVSLVISLNIVFYDIWQKIKPDLDFAPVLGLMDFLSVCLNLFMLYCSILLYKKRPLARWYLIAVIPGILSVSGLKILEISGVKMWYSLPYVYLGGMVWHALVLMTGFTFYVKDRLNPKMDAVENPQEPQTEKVENHLLSKREIDILLAFTNGFSYTEISDAMFISPHTVRTHLKNIYSKIGVNSKAEAVRWVLENLK